MHRTILLAVLAFFSPLFVSSSGELVALSMRGQLYRIDPMNGITTFIQQQSNNRNCSERMWDAQFDPVDHLIYTFHRPEDLTDEGRLPGLAICAWRLERNGDGSWSAVGKFVGLLNRALPPKFSYFAFSISVNRGIIYLVAPFGFDDGRSQWRVQEFNPINNNLRSLAVLNRKEWGRDLSSKTFSLEEKYLFVDFHRQEGDVYWKPYSFWIDLEKGGIVKRFAFPGNYPSFIGINAGRLYGLAANTGEQAQIVEENGYLKRLRSTGGLRFQRPNSQDAIFTRSVFELDYHLNQTGNPLKVSQIKHSDPLMLEQSSAINGTTILQMFLQDESSILCLFSTETGDIIHKTPVGGEYIFSMFVVD
jgi:hypothetical protein